MFKYVYFDIPSYKYCRKQNFWVNDMNNDLIYLLYIVLQQTPFNEIIIINTISILNWLHFRCPICYLILLNKNSHCFHSVNGITLALSQSDHIKRRTIKLGSGRIDCAQEKSCSCTLTQSHSQKISSLQMCFCWCKCSFKFALLVENFAIDS